MNFGNSAFKTILQHLQVKATENLYESTSVKILSDENQCKRLVNFLMMPLTRNIFLPNFLELDIHMMSEMENSVLSTSFSIDVNSVTLLVVIVTELANLGIETSLIS